jgi:LacI family transcriptional regulator
MGTRLRVALDIETSRIYGRRILQGISRYLLSTRSWSVYVEQHEIDTKTHGILMKWKGDGIITRQATPETVKLLKKRGIAAIDLSNFLPPFGLPRIVCADTDIGEMAANHFIERGFNNLCCCTFIGQHWSMQRCHGFVERAKAVGANWKVFERPFRTHAQNWDFDQRRMTEWLKELPKPVGILATNDLLGHHVLDACAYGDLLVPEEVAVLGVDNDELLCGLCTPPLSSIIPDAERIGYEAAQSLDRLMRGEESTPDTIEISPLGIVVRQSTDISAIANPDMARALQFIREHACDGTTVEAVVEHLAVSRSWLERTFRTYLGRSPQAEIRRVQISRCKELMRMTDMPLDRIAYLTGFKHPEYMRVVFKRETGETPGQFRSSRPRK